MDDLATWLRGLLDDEERTATDRGKLRGDVWTAVEVTAGRWEVVGVGGTVADHLSEWEARHIADHDPARALREVAAKRRILFRHQPIEVFNAMVCTHCGVVGGQSARAAAAWPCPELRDLAAPCSDRPGYQEEWRP